MWRGKIFPKFTHLILLFFFVVLAYNIIFCLVKHSVLFSSEAYNTDKIIKFSLLFSFRWENGGVVNTLNLIFHEVRRLINENILNYWISSHQNSQIWFGFSSSARLSAFSFATPFFPPHNFTYSTILFIIYFPHNNRIENIRQVQWKKLHSKNWKNENEEKRISDSHDHLLKSNVECCTSRKSSHKTFRYFLKKNFFLVTSDD